jgi:hypothetical protein
VNVLAFIQTGAAPVLFHVHPRSCRLFVRHNTATVENKMADAKDVNGLLHACMPICQRKTTTAARVRATFSGRALGSSLRSVLIGIKYGVRDSSLGVS